MTFWDFFVLLLIYVPLLLLWGAAIVDIFQRQDLSGPRQAVWVFVVVVLPLLGTLVYLITRPAAPPSRERATLAGSNSQPVERSTATDHAQQLAVLASLHDRGKLTDAEFGAEKQRLIGADVPSQPAAADADRARV